MYLVWNSHICCYMFCHRFDIIDIDLAALLLHLVLRWPQRDPNVALGLNYQEIDVLGKVENVPIATNIQAGEKQPNKIAAVSVKSAFHQPVEVIPIKHYFSEFYSCVPVRNNCSCPNRTILTVRNINVSPSHNNIWSSLIISRPFFFHQHVDFRFKKDSLQM